MDILLVSNSDTCRSRMAQEILNSFSRGMKISTAGVWVGNSIPDVVFNVMEQNGYAISRKKPYELEQCIHQSWDYIITLCPEAEAELGALPSNVKQFHFKFDDPFQNRMQSEGEQEDRVTALYDDMYRQLYEFFREELIEQLLPRCTCGANTYCRCE